MAYLALNESEQLHVFLHYYFTYNQVRTVYSQEDVFCGANNTI